MSLNTFKTSELFQDDYLDKLIAKLEKLGGVYSETINQIKGEAAELVKANQAVNVSTAAGRDENAKQAKQADALATAYKSYNAALAENKTQVEELRQAARTLNELKKNEARLNLAAEGSYNKLAAQYNIIKLNLNAMSKAEREGTEAGRDLVKTANAIYQEMKRLQAETGKTALNVGNYSEAVQEATKNVGEMRKELMALRNTSFAGKTDEEIATINKRIGDLVDGMADLKAEQAALGTEMSSLFVSNLKFVSAGVEGLVGTLSLLGVESENLRNLESKMVQLIAVTQALAEIEDVLQKRTLQTTAARIQAAVINAKDTVTKWANTVATTAAAKAEDAKAIATTRGSLATRAAAAVQWLWNAALAANPIGLVVVGVAALAAGIIYLTSKMGDNVAMTERLTTQLNTLRAAAESNEEFRQFQLKLADEYGKTEVEKTQLSRKLTNERITDIEAELAAINRLGQVQSLDDEQMQRRTELNKELLRLGDERILLGIRETRQTKEAAEAAAKEAKQKAEQAKAERERLAKEAKARLQEKQDAALKELEAERNFQLARFDAETDYGNQTAEYQRQRAGERLNLEQDLGRSILNVQRQYNRISQTEYEAALLQLEATMREFSARITQERNADTAGSLPGIDLSERSKQAALAKVKAIVQDLTDKANAAAAEANADPAKTVLGKLLGIDGKEEEGLKTAFDYAKSQLNDYMQALQRAADLRVQIADRNVAAAQQEYDEQFKLRDAGLAYNITAAKIELDQQKEAQRKALEQQQKVQRQTVLLQSIEQASNLVTAISKVMATLPFPLNLGASAIMTGAFIAAKVKAVQATKQEFAEGDLSVLQGGSHQSGNDIFIGEQNGKKRYAEGGEAQMVLSKRMTRKYMNNGTLPAIFQALKSGQFENQFLRSDMSGLPPVFVTNSTNTKGMERYLADIAANTRRQGNETVQVVGNVIIRTDGNWRVRTKVG